MRVLFVAAIAALAFLAGVFGATNPLARGWGDNIAWETLDAAKVAAKADGKPIMLVIWQSWCGACKSLKPKVAASTQIAAESTQFHMVNVEGDELKGDNTYAPDGGYVPRIFFLSPVDGSVLTSVTSGNPKYQHFFHDAEGILGAMGKAAKEVAAAGLPTSAGAVGEL